MARRVAELAELQEEYRAWRESLPESLQESATAAALRAVTEIDLSELESVEPPRGTGRLSRGRWKWAGNASRRHRAFRARRF